MTLAAIFLAEGLNFLAAAINIRACAKGRTLITLLTDAMICGLNFTLIMWVAEIHTLAAGMAYTAGGVCGSWLGMWTTRNWREGELDS